MEDHDAQIPASLKHRCATCRKEIKNLNHLRRHEVSRTLPWSAHRVNTLLTASRYDRLLVSMRILFSKLCQKVSTSLDLVAPSLMIQRRFATALQNLLKSRRLSRRTRD
jgi:hypothetical protein